MIRVFIVALFNLLFLGCFTVPDVNEENIKNDLLVDNQINSSQVEIKKPNRLNLETSNNIEKLLNDTIKLGRFQNSFF